MWNYQHDLALLSNNLGKYFTAYLELKPEDVEDSSILSYCGNCGSDVKILIPTAEKKDWMRQALRESLVDSPSNLSSTFKHFWFHSRCSKCGADLVLMRS